MSGYYVLSKSAAGKYYFNLKAANHQVILTSEQYESRAAAENGIASVQRNSPDDARYLRKTAARGEPYFVLTAANHQTIGISEMYSSEAARENGIASVKNNGPSTTVKDETESA
jgi:uncharacterized protein YegP (UPF0339 family)